MFWPSCYSHLDDQKNPFDSAVNRSGHMRCKRLVKKLTTIFRVASESEFCLN